MATRTAASPMIGPGPEYPGRRPAVDGPFAEEFPQVVVRLKERRPVPAGENGLGPIGDTQQERGADHGQARTRMADVHRNVSIDTARASLADRRMRPGASVIEDGADVPHQEDDQS